MHQPTFILQENRIIFKGGAQGIIIVNKNGIAVHLDEKTHSLESDKAKSLEKRMRDWYYFTQVKK